LPVEREAGFTFVAECAAGFTFGTIQVHVVGVGPRD
jgi:hypothetical protein